MEEREVFKFEGITGHRILADTTAEGLQIPLWSTSQEEYFQKLHDTWHTCTQLEPDDWLICLFKVKVTLTFAPSEM